MSTCTLREALFLGAQACPERSRTGVPPARSPLPQRLLRATLASEWKLAEDPEWRSRGYLPHRDAVQLIQMVTFRLADSLPASVLDELQCLRAARGEAARRTHAEAHLDAGHGTCYLRRPMIASMVESALLHFDGERYHMLAWSIMPNHVHALIQVLAGHTLAEVLHSWKSYTAKMANRALGRSGAFWQAESWDRYVRDQEHLANAVRYIHGNRSAFPSAARGAREPRALESP